MTSWWAEYISLTLDFDLAMSLALGNGMLADWIQYVWLGCTSIIAKRTIYWVAVAFHLGSRMSHINEAQPPESANKVEPTMLSHVTEK